MVNYIIRRLLLMIPTLIGITALVFFVVASSPGGVGANLVTAEFGMRPEERAAMRNYYNQRYGLDKPLHVQYFKWLNKVSPLGFNADGNFRFKYPDLGESFVRGRPVSGLIAESLPVTLLLNAVSIPVTFAAAILSWTFIERPALRMKQLGRRRAANVGAAHQRAGSGAVEPSKLPTW